MKLCNTQNELTTEYILPVKIIASVNAENVHILLEEHPAQPFLGKAEVSVIKKNGYILFDFGEEFQGVRMWFCRETKKNVLICVLFSAKVYPKH